MSYITYYILIRVTKYLHSLSAFFFYPLGLSFFIAYLFFRNDIGGIWTQWWMQIADLPMAFVALVYGGTSLYLSLTNKEHPSRILAIMIGTVLIVVFAFLYALNFWDVLRLSELIQ